MRQQLELRPAHGFRRMLRNEHHDYRPVYDSAVRNVLQSVDNAVLANHRLLFQLDHVQPDCEHHRHHASGDYMFAKYYGDPECALDVHATDGRGCVLRQQCVNRCDCDEHQLQHHELPDDSQPDLAGEGLLPQFHHMHTDRDSAVWTSAIKRLLQ
jgi:hypothetical protein